MTESVNTREPDRERARRIAEQGLILRGLVGSTVHGLSASAWSRLKGALDRRARNASPLAGGTGWDTRAGEIELQIPKIR